MSMTQELLHLQIPLAHIIRATDDFADRNYLGRGGFGAVYRGTLCDPGATDVAVKRLDVTIAGQGQREFMMEIFMLASYRHPNLASLVGFCVDGGEQIIVYEYEARGSLDQHIASIDLRWPERILICLGAARGLDYLHYGVGPGHRVVHRDIKSSNILLDVNWEAKISDFGLSKIGPTNQEFTFIVTNVCGTFGYVDPSYVHTGVLTKESDVYSFGVVLLEVLCGRPAMLAEFHDERRFLAGLVKHCNGLSDLEDLIEPELLVQISPKSLETFARIACQCLEEDKNLRPTMDLVIQELEMAFEFQMGRDTRLWGSSIGGTAWSWRLQSEQMLRKMTINHEDCIYSIAVTIEDLRDLKYYHSGQYGHSHGNISEINFDDDEEIIGIEGSVRDTTGPHDDHLLISSLCIVTNKNIHGPFGQENANHFSDSWDLGSFEGFFGLTGYFLQGLGCHLRPIL